MLSRCALIGREHLRLLEAALKMALGVLVVCRSVVWRHRTYHQPGRWDGHTGVGWAAVWTLGTS
eukprot:4059147-Alexandrium_andersonii.AAC.1